MKQETLSYLVEHRSELKREIVNCLMEKTIGSINLNGNNRLIAHIYTETIGRDKSIFLDIFCVEDNQTPVLLATNGDCDEDTVSGSQLTKELALTYVIDDLYKVVVGTYALNEGVSITDLDYDNKDELIGIGLLG